MNYILFTMSQQMQVLKLYLKLQKDTSVHGEWMKMRERIINLYEFAALNKICLQCKQFCDITADHSSWYGNHKHNR